MATAGHCMSATNTSCTDNIIVFNATNETMQAGRSLPSNTVYRCTVVVQAVQTNVLAGGQDWAVFRLDRAVDPNVATPVTIASNEMVIGTPLVMIGERPILFLISVLHGWLDLKP